MIYYLISRSSEFCISKITHTWKKYLLILIINKQFYDTCIIFTYISSTQSTNDKKCEQVQHIFLIQNIARITNKDL